MACDAIDRQPATSVPGYGSACRGVEGNLFSPERRYGGLAGRNGRAQGPRSRADAAAAILRRTRRLDELSLQPDHERSRCVGTVQSGIAEDVAGADRRA